VIHLLDLNLPLKQGQ